jgi:hypothetical protein
MASAVHVARVKFPAGRGPRLRSALHQDGSDLREGGLDLGIRHLRGGRLGGIAQLTQVLR